MRRTTYSTTRWLLFLLVFLLCPMLALLPPGWMLSESAAAKKTEKTEEEEEEVDENTPVKLAKEAKVANPGPIRKLFQALATPHDLIRTQPDSIVPQGRINKVVPLRQYIGRRPDFQGSITLVRIEKNGNHTQLKPISSKKIVEVTYFEEVALKTVNDFLAKNTEPRLDVLLAAEKGILFALQFHLGKGRVRKPADAAKWKFLENDLRRKWLILRRDRALAYASANRFEEAFRLAEIILKDRDRARQLLLEEPVLLLLPELTLRKARVEKEDRARQGLYEEVRRLLNKFQSRFPESTDGDSIRKELIARATFLREEAHKLKDPARALEILRDAYKIWPLNGLEEELGNKDDTRPLYIGVRSLPERMSPATALTDSEKQAVELIFEGLIQTSPELVDSWSTTRAVSAGPELFRHLLLGGIWRYKPELATRLPRSVPLGREFLLDGTARWSDGTRFTAEDISHTIALLQKKTAAWGNIVRGSRAVGTGRIRITLDSGFLDPLSLMTFKLLPRNYQLLPRKKDAVMRPLERVEDSKFAGNPLGTGPFQYRGREPENNPRFAVFTANPKYQDRTGRKDLPYIREIRFVVSSNPIRDFKENQLHLLLDLPTQRARELLDADKKEFGDNRPTIRTWGNRRVYFLAINHKKKEALKIQEMRKAFAHAIDREGLLTAHFRAGYQAIDRQNQLKTVLTNEDEQLHPALNGPFPAGSWACCPTSRVPAGANLYNPDDALSYVKGALKTLGEDVDLKLSYPNDDPRVVKACEAICTALSKLTDGKHKIKVTPKPLSPKDFQEDVQAGTYHLAYCQYDYPTDFYWLWPLFDPSESACRPGGSNYLRYQGDSDLESLFQKAMRHRNYEEVKKLTHDLHAHLYDKMPLIPLWQLHTHIAISPNLKPVGIDPVLVFTNVERWRMVQK
jgi:ABC-type transport system substrate-binding protein